MACTDWGASAPLFVPIHMHAAVGSVLQAARTERSPRPSRAATIRSRQGLRTASVPSSSPASPERAAPRPIPRCGPSGSGRRWARAAGAAANGRGIGCGDTKVATCSGGGGSPGLFRHAIRRTQPRPSRGRSWRCACGQAWRPSWNRVKHPHQSTQRCCGYRQPPRSPNVFHAADPARPRSTDCAARGQRGTIQLRRFPGWHYTVHNETNVQQGITATDEPHHPHKPRASTRAAIRNATPPAPPPRRRDRRAPQPQ